MDVFVSNLPTSVVSDFSLVDSTGVPDFPISASSIVNHQLNDLTYLIGDFHVFTAYNYLYSGFTAFSSVVLHCFKGEFTIRYSGVDYTISEGSSLSFPRSLSNPYLALEFLPQHRPAVVGIIVDRLPLVLRQGNPHCFSGYCYTRWFIDAHSVDLAFTAALSLGLYPRLHNVVNRMRILGIMYVRRLPELTHSNQVWHVGETSTPIGHSTVILLLKENLRVGGEDISFDAISASMVRSGVHSADTISKIAGTTLRIDAEANSLLESFGIRDDKSKADLMKGLLVQKDSRVRDALDCALGSRLQDRKTHKKAFREVVNIKQVLSENSELLLEKLYPELELKFKRNLNAPHGFAAASRKCETAILLAELNYDPKNSKPPKGYSARVVDIGGNWSTHIFGRRNFVHSCCPILSPYDNIREGARRDMINCVNMGPSTPEDMKMLVNLYRDPKTRCRIRCSKKAQECKVKSPHMMAVHSLYDMSLNDIANAMESHRATVLRATLIFSPEILVNSCGTLLPLNVNYKVDQKADLITFSFVGDASLCYSHRFSMYKQLFGSHVAFADGGSRYFIQLGTNRGGVQYLSFHRACPGPIPAGKLSHSLWIGEVTNYRVISYYSFDVRANSAKEALIPKRIVVPVRQYEMVKKFAMRFSDTKFNVNELFNTACAVDNRVIVDGVSVQVSEPMLCDSLLDLTHAVYLECYILRYNYGRIDQKVIEGIKKERELSEADTWKKLWLIMKQPFDRLGSMVHKLDTWLNHWIALENYFPVKIEDAVQVLGFSTVLDRFTSVDGGEWDYDNMQLINEIVADVHFDHDAHAAPPETVDDGVGFDTSVDRPSVVVNSATLVVEPDPLSKVCFFDTLYTIDVKQNNALCYPTPPTTVDTFFLLTGCEDGGFEALGDGSFRLVKGQKFHSYRPTRLVAKPDPVLKGTVLGFKNFCKAVCQSVGKPRAGPGGDECQLIADKCVIISDYRDWDLRKGNFHRARGSYVLSKEQYIADLRNRLVDEQYTDFLNRVDRLYDTPKWAPVVVDDPVDEFKALIYWVRQPLHEEDRLCNKRTCLPKGYWCADPKLRCTSYRSGRPVKVTLSSGSFLCYGVDFTHSRKALPSVSGTADGDEGRATCAVSFGDFPPTIIVDHLVTSPSSVVIQDITDTLSEDAEEVVSVLTLVNKPCNTPVYFSSITDVSVDWLEHLSLERKGKRECAFMSDDPTMIYSHDTVSYITQEFPPELIRLKILLTEKFGSEFNSCLLNKYQRGGSIPWHADDELCYDDNHPIVTLNLRGTAVFKTKCSDICGEYRMNAGDVFVMPEGFQNTHKHTVCDCSDGRISLTFRWQNKSCTKVASVIPIGREVSIERMPAVLDGFPLECGECSGVHSYKEIVGDGNCFYSSIIAATDQTLTVADLKERLLQNVHRIPHSRVLARRLLSTPNSFADTCVVFLCAEVLNLRIHIHDLVAGKASRVVSASTPTHECCLLVTANHFSLLAVSTPIGDQGIVAIEELPYKVSNLTLNRVARERPEIETALSAAYETLGLQKLSFARFEPNFEPGESLLVQTNNAVIEQVEYWRVYSSVLERSLADLYRNLPMDLRNTSTKNFWRRHPKQVAVFDTIDCRWELPPRISLDEDIEPPESCENLKESSDDTGVKYQVHDYGFNGSRFVRTPRRLFMQGKCVPRDVVEDIFGGFRGRVLFTVDTVMLQDHRLFNRCKGFATSGDRALPSFELVNGVPGCGKTFYIISNHRRSEVKKVGKPARTVVEKFGDLVLTATREAAADLRRRVTESGGYATRTQYRTLDSFLLNSDGQCWDTVWFDEALMSHFGSVVLCCRMASAKRAVLIGDTNQIPFISRNADVRLKYACASDYVKITKDLNVSYRCPADVAAILAPHYNSGMRSKSEKVRSVKAVKISSLNDVTMRGDDVQYLTFKQCEKLELKRYGFKKVNTVHEFQGKDNYRVAVVRTSSFTMEEVYQMTAHCIVALSRHRGEMVYFTKVLTDKLSKLINTTVDARAAQVSTTDVDIPPATLKCGWSPSLLDVPEKAFCPQPLVSDLNVLQSWYDALTEGAGLIDQSYDQDIVHHSDLDVSLHDCSLIPSRVRALKSKRPHYLPKLQTTLAPARLSSQRETLLGFLKRNANVPELQGTVDYHAQVQDMMDSFLKAFVDVEEMDLLRSFKSRKLTSSSKAIDDWLKGQGDAYRLRISGDGRAPWEKELNSYSYMCKNQIKPCTDSTATTEYKAPQTIAFQEKDVNAIFCPIFQQITERLLAVVKKKFMIFTGVSTDDFEREMTHRFPPELSKGLFSKEVDFSKYDKSQGRMHLLFEITVYRALGLPDEYCYLWWRAHADTLITDKSNGIRAMVCFQRKSGDAATFIGNTIILMGVLASLYDMGSMSFGLFGGDDSILWGPEHILRNDMSYTAAHLFNLESKFFNYKNYYFSSKFLLPVCGRWYMVPDPLRLVSKWGRDNVVSPEHLEEYYTSQKDLLKHFNNSVLNFSLNDGLNERYPSIIGDHTICYGSIAYRIKSLENFKELFSDPGNLSSDPSRAKLD